MKTTNAVLILRKRLGLLSMDLDDAIRLVNAIAGSQITEETLAELAHAFVQTWSDGFARAVAEWQQDPEDFAGVHGDGSEEE